MLNIPYTEDFPIFKEVAAKSKKPFIYLDSAASTQKPKQVITAVTNCYRQSYANVHRGIYTLSANITAAYEAVRKVIQQFIGANTPEEIIFTSGTTEGINLIANSYATEKLQAGDEVILSEMEHHSNIVPWYLLKKKMGIVLKVIPITQEGTINLADYQSLFSKKTKLVSIVHASNVLGTINPIREMIDIAHAKGAKVLIDGAQAIAHLPVNVKELDCDFYAFSAHKLYGPTGVGILFGKQALLEELPPFHGGGGMIETVNFEEVTFQPSPQRFEAGTPNIAGVIGLEAAIHYLKVIGMKTIATHDQSLLTFAESVLQPIPGVQLIGTAKQRIGVLSFVISGMHPHDIATILDHEGIAVRAGHHCAMPLMNRLGLTSTIRVSFGVYNHEEEIKALVAALTLARKILRK